VRIGVLTGGGDCPGLNAAIRAVVRRATVTYQDEVIGFLAGWQGVIENDFIPLDIARCRGILPRGGTILRTSRVNPYKVPGGVEKVKEVIASHNIDAMVVIGGEGTLGASRELAEAGVPLVGIPKTIDNDVFGTDYTIGFDTAVQIAVDAIDRLHTTAEAHDRVMVCEVMGRHVGWIATYAGLAAGAAVVLVPEEPFDIAQAAARLKRRHALGRFASVVVVAEGAKPVEGTLELPPVEYDAYDHERLGGIGSLVAQELERLTGLEARVTMLGHVLRGGSPSAFDRMLATRFGVAAIDSVHQEDYGKMIGIQGHDIVTVPLSEAVGDLKKVNPALMELIARVFLE
jgi:6-phosphofructokinase 1